ncbi:N-acetyltransferase domain-containing protein [Mycena indigotica]|uniref:N-acetyltransferase domain-containing protein n=1 Tax=Mycena indigotica TaxID=2126181 RepID=A0A8H6TCW6_9AGAR|nr:N-acetyltransferase domain-containing protein [Mycena indigotica]KAF7316505.1 N-acetyltransferase domain-containing protein [Mycena indigotica]
MALPLVSLSGRLILSPPTERDDPHFVALRSHPETRQYIPRQFFPDNFTVEAARARRESRASDPAIVDFSIRSKDGDEYLGAIGIFHVDEAMKSCESGVAISPAAFRTGVATEAFHAVMRYAFETRGLHRVVFHTAASNVRMRGLLDGAGAKLEGILREVWPANEGDGFSDACVYSILAQEWTETVKSRLEERISRL